MYFLAGLCPEEISIEVQNFKVWMQLHYGCKVALKSPSHITFIPPFWFRQSEEELLIQTLNDYDPVIESVLIDLTGFSHFSNRVIFIETKNNVQLNQLKESIENHFRKAVGAVIKTDERKFHPHVTIANRDLKPGDFNSAWQHFASKKYSANFLLNKLSLMKHVQSKWQVVAEKIFQ